MTIPAWPELEAFIRKEAGIRASQPVRPADSLENDLDLTGDDADDFMGKFFARFPVEPGDYAFGRYFSEEGFSLLAVVAMPFSKRLRDRYEKAPLTVAMLARAIDLGVWDSEQLAAAAGG